MARFRQLLASSPVRLHYCDGDYDHNRTVTAFSGPPEATEKAVFALCDLAFPLIDMTRHDGVHPAIGALDVCPFIALAGELRAALEFTEGVANTLADRYRLPVVLYERSERGHHTRDLPSIRAAFGAAPEGEPDFGPLSNPQLGTTVIGVRDFLIAMNLNYPESELDAIRRLAKRLRELRGQGDSRFPGVRALGLPLVSRNLAQLSMNLTQPDRTTPDSIVEWVTGGIGSEPLEAELVGVIRDRDLPGASRLPVKPDQVVR